MNCPFCYLLPPDHEPEATLRLTQYHIVQVINGNQCQTCSESTAITFVVKADQGARFLASLPLGRSCLQQQHRSGQEIRWNNARITNQVTADKNALPETTL
jgi:hypothetical protein